jgi:indolepyruvate decarboxylase
MSKGLLSESNKLYMGMYNGEFSPVVSTRVEKDADLVLDLGGVAFCDEETGEFSANLDPSKVVTVWPDHVEIGWEDKLGGRGQATYGPIHMKDVLEALTNQAPKFNTAPFLPPVSFFPTLNLELEAVFLLLQQFLAPGDTLVADTGIGDLLAMGILLPDGVQFQHALLWGSIGWGTAAALGVALADPSRRVVLVQGDGGHQCTANQIGVMGLYGVKKPIILVLNNGVYGIEEFVMGNSNADKTRDFDKIAPWQYQSLPAAMGCSGWSCTSVGVDGLADALGQARKYPGAAYIDIVLKAELLLPALPRAVRDRMYQTRPPKV